MPGNNQYIMEWPGVNKFSHKCMLRQHGIINVQIYSTQT